jgi:Ni,Fe-hydrogenase III large subunit
LTYFKEFDLPRVRVNGHWVDRKKSVYIVVFQEGRQLRERITRICDSFMGQRFDLPNIGGIPTKISEIKHNIQESKTLIDHSRKQLKNYLAQINLIGGEGMQN